MVHIFSLDTTNGHDNDASTKGVNTPRRGAQGHDYLDDTELLESERAFLRQFMTPRIGHGRRRCWPVSEVAGDG
jgi:hypothetical protein